MTANFRIGVVILVVGLNFGCGKGSSSPTAPTVAAPSGCSGAAVERIEINFGGQGQETGVAIQLFGKTINQQIAAGQQFAVTENVVPCSYEVSGQMLGRVLSVGFSRTPPFKDFSGSVGKGVEKGSVVVDEGPNPEFGPATGNCVVNFRQNAGGAPPYNIKIRFRVANSNAVGGQGGGCG
jgi:hypothetical protein